MSNAVTSPRLTRTEEVFIDMLKENTGRHMLDSGNFYGRNWEQNQSRNFIDEPYCTLSFRYGIEVSLNLFHFLKQRLVYNWFLQGQFTRFANSKAHADDSWFENVRDFTEMKARKAGFKDGYEGWPYADNTYNYNSLLSQGLWYTRWIDDDGEHYIVMIHGGCDVRGGYTAPKAFDAKDWYSLCDYNVATIVCSKCYASWRTDDGYNWCPEDDAIRIPPPHEVSAQLAFHIEVPYNPAPFELLPLRNLSWESQKAYEHIEVEEFPKNPERGILYIDTEGKGLCPYCFKGVLEAMPH